MLMQENEHAWLGNKKLCIDPDKEMKVYSIANYAGTECFTLIEHTLFSRETIVFGKLYNFPRCLVRQY
jgi:hypothetical protein